MLKRQKILQAFSKPMISILMVRIRRKFSIDDASKINSTKQSDKYFTPKVGRMMNKYVFLS